MGKARKILLLSSSLFSLYARAQNAPTEATASPKVNSCVVTLRQLALRKAKKELTPLIVKAARPAGLIVGTSNDIVIALTGQGFIPNAIAKWLPMSNEMANVAAGSTGRRWIYSGISKILADNVAMGSMVGHSVNQTIEHGPVNGGLTMLASFGLTYWFPNKYFHSIMHGIPSLIPAALPKTKSFAKTGAGQATIGVSMIVIEEVILLKTEALIDKVPPVGWGHRAGESKEPAAEKPKAEPSPAQREARSSQAAAAYLVEGKLFGDDKTSDEDRDRMLIFLTGATHEEGLFSQTAKSAAPSLPVDAKKLESLKSLMSTEGFVSLLTPEELGGLRERVQSLATK